MPPGPLLYRGEVSRAARGASCLGSVQLLRGLDRAHPLAQLAQGRHARVQDRHLSEDAHGVLGLLEVLEAVTALQQG